MVGGFLKGCSGVSSWRVWVFLFLVKWVSSMVRLNDGCEILVVIGICL